LLPVENPGYLFVRESAATMKENYKSFHQEEGIIIIQAIIDNLRGGTRFRVSSEYGGVLTVYFGAPSMFITLWFGFDCGTNPPLGTLII
jgi:hypothetical protein